MLRMTHADRAARRASFHLRRRAAIAHPAQYFILALGLVAMSASVAHAANEPEPLWAYGFLTPPAPADKAIPQSPPSRKLRANKPPEEQNRLRHVEGSTAAYSKVDIRDGHNVVDWFPGDHPPMSDVMRHGPASLGEKSLGCALCHLPSGKGRPENAPVVGLPVAYFIRQLEDFRNGVRASADPRKPNTPTR